MIRTYGFSGKDYRVATIFKLYLLVTKIILQSFKINMISDMTKYNKIKYFADQLHVFVCMKL